jgi:hypothetical protein
MFGFDRLSAMAVSFSRAGFNFVANQVAAWKAALERALRARRRSYFIDVVIDVHVPPHKWKHAADGQTVLPDGWLVLADPPRGKGGRRERLGPYDDGIENAQGRVERFLPTIHELDSYEEDFRFVVRSQRAYYVNSPGLVAQALPPNLAPMHSRTPLVPQFLRHGAAISAVSLDGSIENDCVPLGVYHWLTASTAQESRTHLQHSKYDDLLFARGADALWESKEKRRKKSMPRITLESVRTLLLVIRAELDPHAPEGTATRLKSSLSFAAL